MSSSTPQAAEYPPVDLSVPQFTFRAVLTGMILGGALSLCNIYTGLKIGWGFNMSVTAALLSFGIFQVLSRTTGAREWNILENNINQTAASSAASISSAGLVSAVPAWTMLTDQTLTWPVLSLWVFSVALVGVLVGVGLRKQMLLTDKLPFPMGIATAETLKQMYAQGAEAIARVKMLIGGLFFAAGLYLYVKLFHVSNWYFPGTIPEWWNNAKLKAQGLAGITLKNMTFAVTPSMFMIGGGALIGMRACASLLLGAVVTWGYVAPMIIHNGWVNVPMMPVDPWGLTAVPKPLWTDLLKQWLLWPGVAMMVVASLTSFAFSWRSVANAIKNLWSKTEAVVQDQVGSDNVPTSMFVIGIIVIVTFSVICQIAIFGIPWGLAIFGVLLTFLLAIVAARVSGETGITPVGPMGKVTQLTLGAIDPGNVTANLMAANVTGGAASQAADMMHDLKTGLMVGSSARYQAMAQAFGVLAGSLAGSAAYLLLIHDPKSMLMTAEWAAPAVAQWKAVAELFREGFDKMPKGAISAIWWGGAIGMALAILEKVVPKKVRPYMPSAASIGLAMVIPAFYSISFFIGGVLALIASRVAPKWSARFVIVIAAGLIAGESLAGIIVAFIKS
ncbi:MAG: OPT family oligopeptide transporter [Deltaproteobacteria bacterium]|nr:MAG: OPT family oligopeptide transporter [Deltaproteobacteria bacterium]